MARLTCTTHYYADKGRRNKNQDMFLLGEEGVWAVADGFWEDGEIAAQYVVSRLAELGKRQPWSSVEQMQKGVRQAARDGRQDIEKYVRANPSANGMGSTMVAGLWAPNLGCLVIGHMGNSRAYRVRKDELKQLTHDHLIVSDKVRRGEISPERATTHEHRAVLSRSVVWLSDPQMDREATGEPEFTAFEPLPGDSFLLCTDGLHNMIGPSIIHRLALTHDGDKACRYLVREVLLAASQGADNVTVVLVRFAAA